MNNPHLSIPSDGEELNIYYAPDPYFRDGVTWEAQQAIASNEEEARKVLPFGEDRKVVVLSRGINGNSSKIDFTGDTSLLRHHQKPLDRTELRHMFEDTGIKQQLIEALAATMHGFHSSQLEAIWPVIESYAQKKYQEGYDTAMKEQEEPFKYKKLTGRPHLKGEEQ